MTYEDKTPMPFGKHKGKPLEDVPASYLLWLWDEGLRAEERDQGNRGALHRYIKDSFSALMTDAKDYIVQHPPK